MADNRRWLRRVRELITQASESAAILLNTVNRRKQIYVSDVTARTYMAQVARN